MEVFLGNCHLCTYNKTIQVEELQSIVALDLGLCPDQFYFISNGRKITGNTIAGRIYIVPRVLGGKGGFGSMLRAIGAQIEKTTNREACRDLSGRRLRDINEEQRLKKWVDQQAEREKDAKQKKKKKLEKLLEKPRHEFKDEQYDKERSSLPDKVEDAVLQGLEASCSSAKRKTDNKKSIPKKKPKLWLDSELDEDISSSGSESEDNEPKSSASNHTVSQDSSAVQVAETSTSSIVDVGKSNIGTANGSDQIENSKSESNVVLDLSTEVSTMTK